MRLNRKTLRKMILSEIKKLQESREDHIQGIKNKIASLEAELERQKSAHPLYGGRRVDSISQMSMHDETLGHIGNIESKIRLLKDQLAAFANPELDPYSKDDQGQPVYKVRLPRA